MKSLDLKNFNVKIYSSFFDCKEKIIIPTQTHGSNFVEIITGEEKLNDCDALVTSSKEFKLGVKTADCAPVCYGDGDKIGIAHIGWPGLCTDLNEKMLKNFDISNLQIFISPFIHRFEIQKDFCYEKLKIKFEKFIEFKDDKIFFNFKEALLSILPENVVLLDGRNTFEDLSLPSYRRDKTKDRLLTVVSFK